MVTVTITFGWVQVAALAYVIISLMLSVAAISHDMQYANTTFWQSFAIGFIWPIVVISLTSIYLGFGGIGDWYESIVDFIQQARCSHEGVRNTSQWTKEKSGADEICEDCGKLFE